MGEGSGQVGQGLGGQRGSDQVRQEIEETRQDLGDTVSSLAEKADPKSQAKDKATQIKSTVQDKVAGGLAMAGKSNLQKGTPPAPQQAVESTKEDVAWVKDRAKPSRV